MKEMAPIRPVAKSMKVFGSGTGGGGGGASRLVTVMAEEPPLALEKVFVEMVPSAFRVRIARNPLGSEVR